MVINGRVLRKLCLACKEAFNPDPATLKKLNLSADSGATLYKAREQPVRDAKGNPVPCDFCHDLRFKGREGVYEILLVDDEVKASVQANKPVSQAFRKQKGRYLQEEALRLVENGDTSVQEVLRVLKPAGESEAKPPPPRTPPPIDGATKPPRSGPPAAPAKKSAK
jgi:type II secretory ATPase GspE/PulE/Tfp pilus assembly ATPase PilB-like protein